LRSATSSIRLFHQAKRAGEVGNVDFPTTLLRCPPLLAQRPDTLSLNLDESATAMPLTRQDFLAAAFVAETGKTAPSALDDGAPPSSRRAS
jgi:hypothetical protein